MLRCFYVLFSMCFLCFSQENCSINIKCLPTNPIDFISSNTDTSIFIITNDTTISVNASQNHSYYLKSESNLLYLFLINDSFMEISYLDDKFEVKGEHSDFIMFLNEYYRIYYPEIQKLSQQYDVSDEFEINLYNFINDQVFEFYKNHDLFPNFKDEAQKYFIRLLKYQYLDAISSYLLGNQEETMRSIASYNNISIDLLNRIEFNKNLLDTAFYELSFFQDYIMNSSILFVLYDHRYSIQVDTTFNNFNKYFLQFIEHNIPKDFLFNFFNIYINKFQSFFTQKTSSHVSTFLSNNGFEEFEINNLLDNLILKNSTNKEENKQKKVFDFYLKDLHGQPISLDDFQGYILYVDIWASWCGPCRKQFPYSEELKTQFSKRQLKQIKFIYISIDNDFNKWKDALNKFDISGYHFISPSNEFNSISNCFSVSSIPRYILIGKNGDILNNNAKRPSDSSLFRDLLDLIN